MVQLGILFIVLGAGSLILPQFDIQFRLMELVDAYQPWAGIGVAALGAVLLIAKLATGKSSDASESAAAES